MTAPDNLHTRTLFSTMAAIGITQTELAQRLGVHRYQVRDWIRRGRIPPIHWARMIRLAKSKGIVISEKMLAADRRAARRGSI